MLWSNVVSMHWQETRTRPLIGLWVVLMVRWGGVFDGYWPNGLARSSFLAEVRIFFTFFKCNLVIFKVLTVYDIKGGTILRMPRELGHIWLRLLLVFCLFSWHIKLQRLKIKAARGRTGSRHGDSWSCWVPSLWTFIYSTMVPLAKYWLNTEDPMFYFLVDSLTFLLAICQTVIQKIICLLFKQTSTTSSPPCETESMYRIYSNAQHCTLAL